MEILFLPLSLVQGFPAQNLPPVINCGGNFFACLGFFFLKILQIILALALVLATIMIAWAGILYITKGSSGEKGKEIHQRIIFAALGLVVAFLAFVFIKMLEIWISGMKI